ncbi:cleavage and polyadenylation specificity factor subunit 7 [Bombina bombina]|uniref:cleavage and polyadenylation specificity factor subunit 7 n=1 Tax=Bombina bombina TaxID=8345 RepID=UPI00235AF6FC|nr:cleavage and polyadenylation specificity factor subunit 7 [Bombina bombina]
MADGADLIDIYAEEEFIQETEFAAEQIDLYDDVLAVTAPPMSHMDGNRSILDPSSPAQASPKSNNKSPAILYTYNNSRKKASICVGHFPWWTTDEQLLAVIRSVGIRDPVEVKFAENRANGQSKGFAEVIVSSEATMVQLLELLPERKLNGVKLDVRPANRQNLSFFEALSRKKIPPRANSKGSVDSADGASTPTDPSLMSPSPETPKTVMPFFTHPPMMEHPSRLPLMPMPRPPMSIPPPPSPGIATAYRGPPVPTMHYPHLMPPPPRVPPLLSLAPPSGVPPALHLNPAFFPPPNSILGPPPDPYKMVRNPYAYGREMKNSLPNVSEAEFEELMNRNRAISRSALSNAVSGATSGDYTNSIKTLETAIAVIKESRVANDERCRVLLTSLKDCLRGIEDKANSSRKRHRSRERSSSRSRESSSRRHRDHEDRTDDYYHDRHRERDRHR